MSLARFTPIDEFFSPFFGGALVPEFREMSSALANINPSTGRFIALDFTENESAYALKADLPGLNKEDIHVTVDKYVNIVETWSTL